MTSGKIIIELHDGRRFTYEDQTVEHIIDDLKAKGVKRGELKNTIHIIPKLNAIVLGGQG